MSGPVTPYERSRFHVEIDGISVSGFSEVTPPSGYADIRYYRDGSHPGSEPVAMRGQVRTTPLTLRRGFEGNLELHQWWNQVRTGMPSARRLMRVVLLDDALNPVTAWTIVGAFPCRHYFERLEASSSEVVIEVVEVVYDHYEVEDLR